MADPVTPQERERETRGTVVFYSQVRERMDNRDWWATNFELALDAYRDAIEARVRWEDATPEERAANGWLPITDPDA